MSILKSGLCVALNDEVLIKLRSNCIRTNVDFLCKDPEQIVNITGIAYKDVISIRNIILAKYSSMIVDGGDFYHSIIECSTILSSGIKSLDEILDGGLYSREVTEIAGDIASGKTQICLCTCGSTLTRGIQTVIYIDTGAGFSARRILQLTPNCSENFVSRVHVFDVTTIYELLSVLDKILALCKDGKLDFYKRLNLLILDNVASVVYPCLSNGNIVESQGLISLLSQKLKYIATGLSVAVLVTNNLVKGEHGKKVASLGRVWLNVPNVRLTIEQNDQYYKTTRKVMVTKNNRGKIGGSCTINFTEHGPIQ
ncbi:DNA repair protein rad51d [Mactra antiquata]